MKIKDILCFIPARKGSKGIKNKNEKKIKGKELYKYTFETAEKLKKQVTTLVSSDSKNILRASKKFDFLNNGIRPKKLSGDKVQTIDVLKYELKKIEKKLNHQFKYILLLQVTSPFRNEKKIIQAIKFIKSKSYDSVISVCSVGGYHPERMKIIQGKYLKNFNKSKKENMKPRQLLKKVFLRSGSFYLIEKDKLYKNKSFVGNKCKGIIVKNKEAINIDSIFDLVIARNIN